jgi:CDP-2,3-bis-(O-geranylgeranyl)-sn-glycerol synthase
MMIDPWYVEMFKAFLLFLPAGMANMTPVLASKIPLLRDWKTPMDLGLSFRGKRLLGDNKTWRGVVAGVVVGGAVCYYLELAIHNSPSYGVFLFGAWLSLGALVGDAVESFFKRQRGTPAGQSWFPLDQIDYILGGLLFIYPLVRPSLATMAYVLAIYFVMHVSIVYIFYLLHVRDRPI